MAGSGRRVFQPGEVLTASNVMNYLQDQAVQVYAGTAARGSAIGTAVAEGMVSYLNDTDSLEVYRAIGTAAPGWDSVAFSDDVPTLGGVGLVPIIPTSVGKAGGSSTASIAANGKVSFGLCTSLSINGVFSSQFESYKIIIRKTVGSANVALKFRLRDSSDYTGIQHYLQGIIAQGTSAPGVYSANNITFIEIGRPPTTDPYYATSIDIHNPFQSDPVSLLGQSYGFGGSSVASYTFGCLIDPGVSSTGFTIFSNTSDTYSGEVSIFGYKV